MNHPVLIDVCKVAQHALAKGSTATAKAIETGEWWSDYFAYGDRLYVADDGVIRIHE